MQQELKKQIIDGALRYMEQNNLSQSDVARLTGINSSYLSLMLRYQFTTRAGSKDVDIADRYLYMLSEWAMLPYRKQYWEPLPTRQFTEVLAQLEHARKHCHTVTLICDSGFGKSYIVDRFQHRYPRQCIKVTINSTYRLKDILSIICEKLGIEQAWSTSITLAGIIDKLKDLKRQGEKIIIVIDEAENMQLPVFKMLKGLYDGVLGYAAIALVATDQLIHSLERLRKRDAVGIPQLCRRLKAGTKLINNHTAGFKLFFDKYIPGDKGLQKLLLTLCSNYGELHDYLEPVLREADAQAVPVTEDLFRIYHNLPNY
ncbi:MAG TPA: AAA family ATPase [Ferruginibacter sp.]|nr:AAA family ATPase [Ferruginibacter sp.]HMP20931.1 AAA family ATPase [Ferruginibacter sp.]